MKLMTGWMIGALLVCINLIMYFFQPGGEEFGNLFGSFYTSVCGLFAIIGMVSAVNAFKVMDSAKRSWILLMTGIFFFFIADTMYAVMESIVKLNMDEMFPSAPDIFYILAYIPIGLSMFMFLNNFKKSGMPFGKWKPVLIPAFTAMLIVVLVMVKFVFIPIVNDTETSFLAKLVYFFYPLADMIVLIPAIILVYVMSLFGAGLFSRPWQLIALGFILLAAGDLIYAYMSWSSSYSSGGILDMTWNFAYILFAVGALYQRKIVAPADGGKV